MQVKEKDKNQVMAKINNWACKIIKDQTDAQCFIKHIEQPSKNMDFIFRIPF